MTTLADLEQAANDGGGMPLPEGPQAAVIRTDASVSATAVAAAVGVSERAWRRYERRITRRFATADLDRRAGRVLLFLAEGSEATS